MQEVDIGSVASSGVFGGIGSITSPIMVIFIIIMMGYAIRVGIGRATLDELKEALERKPRLVTHYKAPAEGLCLEEVYYDEDELLLPHPHP